MANITRRGNGNGNSPSHSFSSLVDAFFNDTLSRFFDDGPNGQKLMSGRNQVPVNIRETEKHYEMELVAPGLKKEDFNIQLDGDVLTVSFEHKEENKEEDKEKGYLRQEYS